ncbi:MAG TPA: fasciclin domain-containing protein, partial [Hanamia sp.]|nr:fasciclin domain-containing protein [Hanamia sp.]
MKENILRSFTMTKLCLLSVLVLFFTSCNKPLPDAVPISYPPANSSATTTIYGLINTDTSYSFFKAAATKVGMLAQLNDSVNSVFTVFLPNNNAFRASGIPSLAVVNSLPVQTLGGIVGYSIIPGTQLLAADIPASTAKVPNMQLPTSVKIGTLPGTPIDLKLTTFASTSATGFYDNNVPVVKPDLKMKNGVIHLVAALVAPPAQLLKDAIYNNPNLSYFKAAIARADSGQTGLNRLDSLLGYAVTNMTVLVPDNAAVQAFLFGTIYSGLVQQGMSPENAATTATQLASSQAVFNNPAFFGSITAQMVRGLLVYHFLATNTGAGFQPNIRVFSNNFSSTPA